LPTYRIEFNHSAMRPGFRGSCIKTAHTPAIAASFLGAYSATDRTIIAKGCVIMTNVEIHEEI
jgi:hypothetical protein